MVICLDILQHPEIKEKLEDYAFLTLHRPSNVDTKSGFSEIAEALNAIADEDADSFSRASQNKKDDG